MSIYRKYTPVQVEELLSNYLIDSWSYSRVATFARNEKEFEMRYLYNVFSKFSATSVAGSAYHEALELFFGKLASGETCDVIDMQLEATEYINSQPADSWKIQKTLPTVQDCIDKATNNAYKGIENFLVEQNKYTDEIAKVIAVELKLTEWLVVNGVDIPLPCNMRIDLVVETTDGKKVIIDHKLKTAFTNQDDITFTIGKQAIVYVLGYEAKYNEKIDEVWFIENKISKNRDKSDQLIVNRVVMDDGTRRLYEAMLYEPLKRMIEAAANPDYVYIINDNDNFTSKAELYEFWAKTMLDEIEAFNIPEDKKPLMEKRRRKIKDSSLTVVTPNVIRNFKKYAEQFIPYDFTNKDMTNEQKIEHVLRSFNIATQVQHTFGGYSSNTYLLEIGAGVAVNSVMRYRLDIANALNQPNVRIGKELTVYNGKSFLSIEAGKKSTSTLFYDPTRLVEQKIPIGIDNLGQTVFWDMNNQSTPHVLVCGATGSGKSVCIKSTIKYALQAGVNDIYIFDPKYEFNHYKSKGITVVNDIEDIEIQMGLLVLDMEERVKNGTSRKTLVIFDEFADAVANSRKGKELKNYEMQQVGIYANGNAKMQRVEISEDKSLEENMRVMLQKGRSSGFRIMAATQRASVKVITGDAKVNFPVQICFRVPKDIDSIVVIDEPGAESLNGRGDGLIKSPELNTVTRFQGFYTE
ncbi:MAG: DNA translocase FtsK [Tissierellia bacterium]|nr:DNA translocase FtsK [Tissierellia bacterium]